MEDRPVMHLRPIVIGAAFALPIWALIIGFVMAVTP